MVDRPARRPDRTTAVNSGRRRRRACAGNTSGGEVLATLAPTAGEDRPARAGTHPQPEAVGLGPTAVVRLERALAHEVLPLHGVDGCASAGGRAHAGRPGRTARCRAPVLPEAGHCEAGRSRPQTPTSIAEDGPPPVGRADPDRSWSTRGPPFPERHAAHRALRLARNGHRVVAGLWTGLLASPSLRVGRQGHGVWAAPVGQPTAVTPVVPPEEGCDQQRR